MVQIGGGIVDEQAAPAVSLTRVLATLGVTGAQHVIGYPGLPVCCLAAFGVRHYRDCNLKSYIKKKL